MNSNQPLHSIDDSHAVSVDEALMLILGIRGELKHYIDGEEIDVFLEDILIDIQEKADADLGNAKADMIEYVSSSGDDEAKLKVLEKVIQQYQMDFEKANELVADFNNYSQKLKHEIAKARSGQQSLLVIDPDETQRMGYPQITKISLYEWCKSELKLDLLSPAKPVTNLASTKRTDTLAKNNSITTYLLAFLLGKLVDKARDKELLTDGEYKADGSLKYIVNGDKVTAAALFRYFKQELPEYENQSHSAVVRRISNAQKLKSDSYLQALSEEDFSSAVDDGANSFRSYHGGKSLPDKS